MLVLDVNVLVALHRPDQGGHSAATEWWQDAVASGATVTAPDSAWAGFVRIVSHRRIFEMPSTLDDAFGFLRAMHAQPTYLPLGPLPAVLDELERICLDSGARADLVPDAYIAAVARSLGAGVVTFDRDFRRFDGLELVELG